MPCEKIAYTFSNITLNPQFYVLGSSNCTWGGTSDAWTITLSLSGLGTSHPSFGDVVLQRDENIYRFPFLYGDAQTATSTLSLGTTFRALQIQSNNPSVLKGKVMVVSQKNASTAFSNPLIVNIELKLYVETIMVLASPRLTAIPVVPAVPDSVGNLLNLQSYTVVSSVLAQQLPNVSGINTLVSYFGAFIPNKTTITNSIPYFALENEENIVVIDLVFSSSFFQQVTAFSMYPYIQQFTTDTNTFTTVGSSTNYGLNGIDLSIYNSDLLQNDVSGGVIQVYFTFNVAIAEKYNNPSGGTYSILLPVDYVGSNYYCSILARFEPQILLSTSIFQGIVSYYNTKSDETYGDQYATSTYIVENYPTSIPPFLTTPTTDGKTVQYYIDQFLITWAKTANQYKAFPNLTLPIYTYFSVVNNNKTVVDFYSNQNNVNALLNNPNENYYQTKIYTTIDVSGVSYALQEIVLLTMNQAFTGSGIESNIQVYVLIGEDVSSATPIQTITTSPSVPYMSASNYPGTTYDQIGNVTTETPPFSTTTLPSSSWSSYNPSFIYLIERVSNPSNPNYPNSMAGSPVYNPNNNVTANTDTSTTMNFRAFATFAPA